MPRVTTVLSGVLGGVYAPEDLLYFDSSDIRAPMTWDLNGSMEVNGSQLTFVAPRAGLYRVRTRGIHPYGWNCPRYRMTVAAAAQDSDTPPAIH